MKFDRLMSIYWSKGLYYNKRLVEYSLTFQNFFITIQGLSKFTKINFLKKFELNLKLVNFFFLNWKNNKNKIINTYVSSIVYSSSILSELRKYSLIRIYLIKTYKGRAQALGKPSRGQRTWSNAWTAFNYNLELRKFIIYVNKSRQTKTIIKKINYKILARKIKKVIKKPIGFFNRKKKNKYLILTTF